MNKQRADLAASEVAAATRRMVTERQRLEKLASAGEDLSSGCRFCDMGPYWIEGEWRHDYPEERMTEAKSVGRPTQYRKHGSNYILREVGHVLVLTIPRYIARELSWVVGDSVTVTRVEDKVVAERVTVNDQTEANTVVPVDSLDVLDTKAGEDVGPGIDGER